MNSKPTMKQENVIFPALLFFGIFAVMLVAFAPRSTRIEPRPTQVVVAQATEEILAQPTPRDHLELMASGLETVLASDVKAGGRLYGSVCTACHGMNLQGISGLGKSLINSNFVNSLNDDELVAFLAIGRTTQDPLNTTGVAMPARGGNPSLTDENLHQIVDYIRSFNGATVENDLADETPFVYVEREFVPIDLGSISVPSTNTEATETVDVTQTPEVTATSEAVQNPVVEATPVEISSQAAQDYGWYCSTCHGVNGEGSPTVMNSALVGMPIDKDALFTLLTTLPAFGEVTVHTYRGGYPELNDDQLKSLIDYVAVLSGTADTTQSPEITPTVEATPEVQANTQPIDVAQGQADYGWYCSTCHGANGEGSPTVMNSALVGMPIDQEALFTLFTTIPAFGEVTVHTYRGGYPELNDDQLRNLLGYVAGLVGQ
ncbi:MAG: c-type cytochrome [bacterium]|nr:c-type cytochrome [bacterium]